MGSLRSNLHSVAHQDWKSKLTLLHCISSDLKIIHSQELIHRDLHSGNILLNSLHSAYIADLGLSISTSIALKTKRHGIYGIIPYIALETLDRGQYTTASDIYSFGIIMWEILYGKSVSYNQEFGIRLQIEICSNDLRPTVIGNNPQSYLSLMKKCWEKKPENRPSAIEICETLNEWQNDGNVLLELVKSEEIINSTYLQAYPNNIYKSKFIEHTTTILHQGSFIIFLLNKFYLILIISYNI
ncbi:kinase-like domain-containing protein [Gigaspora rosea]|uniref:Kinase-like domain-containing protein n=1 Tax=Gigaspora rosea TaxID=44941 RepID=A0A397V5N0_9GLOM|nr:kinase-like domain-containing protein [Gigaspora rosea]